MISIITINYNNSSGLLKTIQSVISQTYKNIEYIIVDGDSVDESKTIIEEHKQYLQYAISEKDTGIYDAQNKGIRQAKGEYLIILL
jgi:glycosyltransferase involved in cell wall biosynthesis